MVALAQTPGTKSQVQSDEGLEKTGVDDLLLALDDEIEASDTSPDQALGEDDKDNTRGFFEQVVKNLSGSFRLRDSFFHKELEASLTQESDDQQVVDALLKFSTFYATPSIRFDLAGWIELGNRGNTYQSTVDATQDKEQARSHFELNEGYFSLFFKKADLTLGKIILENGLSTLFSPANRYSPTDKHDPFDQKTFGLWQAKLDLYAEDFTFTFVALPIYQASKEPAYDSRWLGDMALQQVVEIPYEETSYFFRSKYVAGGWDFFLSIFKGYNSSSVIRLQVENMMPVYYEEVATVFNTAVGFSTTVGKWELHGESVYNQTLESKDDDYLISVIGFTYTVDELFEDLQIDKVEITLEWSGEKLLKEQQAENYVVSSKSVRPGKDDLIGLVEIKVSENLSFGVLADIEQQHGGSMSRISMRYKPIPDLKIDLASERFSGDEESYFNPWKDNDRSIASVEYTF